MRAWAVDVARECALADAVAVRVRIAVDGRGTDARKSDVDRRPSRTVDPAVRVTCYVRVLETCVP